MTDSVTVGVRVRPLNTRESSSSRVAAWTLTSNSLTSSTTPNRPYTYDAVFPPASTNDDVYHSLAAPVVDAALAGFNATVFAYGQTSSGKTHSMLGTADDPGLTPLAIRHVLRTVAASKTRVYLVRVAYVEIYNDKIRDLQNPVAADLAVREDKAGRVFVDAVETVVESLEDAIAVLEKGQAARHVGETKMNARSSRSHTVFTLQIESKGGEGLDQSFRASSLNLVDLAGSERLKSTGAEGMRQKEGAHINKSLLTLGTIIHTLSEHAGRPGGVGHLPYRDSKLTRLLRPALGGNAKTAVLCAVTPSKLHVEETVSTLKFAERAKKVTNSATRNEVVDYRSKYKEAATELALMRERFTAMEAEVAAMRESTSAGVAASPSDNDLSSPDHAPSEGSVHLASGVDTANAIAMSVELQASREEVNYLKEHVDEVEVENENLRDQLKKKSAEFRGLRSRALELRSAARKAKHSERAVRRALVVSFRKLEEARGQLDISRKKGAHVKIAEGYLEELSESLKSWLPSSSPIDKSASTESLTPPTSEAQEDGGSNGAQALPGDSAMSIVQSTLSGGKRRSSGVAPGEQDGDHQGNTLGGTASVRSVRRKPRPLPEDMVADIDDSEAETDHPMPLDDDDNLETLDDSADDLKLPPDDMKSRISDITRDVSNVEKPKKKPKGWKAFKNFYGYGYTQRGVYDKMIAGHKVPSSAAHISA